ncbi:MULTISPECIES: GNAT family N-acetyltransferase [unclassified Clostridium]|uniref:GNAT family N-acetyltransferase n=1 Tax=unclassified Clostridium TaxID=2614128 RepID=UPI0025C222DF|nr:MULTISPECIES: GNAT family N-acetyltransferase [unclassified Clostridium]
MEFVRINSSDNNYFDDVMNIYKVSFPIFEQRTIKDQMDVLKDDKYNCMAVCESNKLVGILLYWDLDNCKYIEHLAISPSIRGKNYGSRILKEFCENNETIVLEIDPPVDDISIKRLGFYSNLGFKLQEFEHIHPPYRKEYKGHKLKIMSFNKNLSEDEYNKFNVFLKERIMKYSEHND